MRGACVGIYQLLKQCSIWK